MVNLDFIIGVDILHSIAESCFSSTKYPSLYAEHISINKYWGVEPCPYQNQYDSAGSYAYGYLSGWYTTASFLSSYQQMTEGRVRKAYSAPARERTHREVWGVRPH